MVIAIVLIVITTYSQSVLIDLPNIRVKFGFGSLEAKGFKGLDTKKTGVTDIEYRS
jgi:hypothetical protein